MFNALRIILFIFFYFCSIAAFSVSMPRGLGGDERIKIMPYRANSVFQFTGCPYFQSIIEFALGETIETIAMGTPSAWQIIPSVNRIFLKPVELDATTNMTVITDKRMYFFEMRAKEAFGIEDSDIPFIVKFLYPNEIINNTAKSAAVGVNIDMKKLAAYNFEYMLSGVSYDIEPLLIFDDKVFTYMKFRNNNAVIPAIFMVYEDGSEGLVNYRMNGDYVVVEMLSERFTLRYGKQVACVFNERYGASN